MQVLYIDVYFLINLTVDTLALYFSVRLAKCTSSALRLVLGGSVGAVFATLTVLFEISGFLYFLLLFTSALILVLIVGIEFTQLKRLKIFVSFLVLETFLGGFVSFAYSLLDKYLYPMFSNEEFGTENRNFLLLAMIVLMSFGVLKLLFSLFSGTLTEKYAEFSFSLLGKPFKVLGMIDSGNILKDPMNMLPVVILKSQVVKDCIKNASIDNVYSLPEEIKRCVRFIPTKSLGTEKILLGFKTDIFIKGHHNKVFKKNAVIALDNEKGSFGGYNALIPTELVV